MSQIVGEIHEGVDDGWIGAAGFRVYRRPRKGDGHERFDVRHHVDVRYDGCLETVRANPPVPTFPRIHL